MKALSYRDPWGWLVALGIKPVDNRAWGTSFTGRIYIHVSKTFDYDGFNYICVHPELIREMDTRGKNFCIEEWAALAVMQPNAGKIIGEVDVTACIRKDVEDIPGVSKPSIGDKQRELEILKRDCPEYFSPWFFGPFGLVHKNSELYPRGIPCKGKVFPHFFDPGPEVEANILRMKENEHVDNKTSVL
jgi:hypothetical protein